MSKERNNCYQCPHRREVPGSAHSECALGMPIKLRFMRAHAEGNLPLTFTNKETGDLMLKFDSYGVRKGWCKWPVNFDPIWVECYLPIENPIENKDV